jgi:hypothetical protein
MFNKETHLLQSHNPSSRTIELGPKNSFPGFNCSPNICNNLVRVVWNVDGLSDMGFATFICISQYWPTKAWNRLRNYGIYYVVPLVFTTITKLQPDAAAKRKARYKVCKSTQFSLVQKENRCNCGKLWRTSDSLSWSYRNGGLGLGDHCGKQTWTWSTPGLHRSPCHVQGSHLHYALIWVRWFLLRGSAATRGPTKHTCPLPYLLMLGYQPALQTS